MTCRTLLDRLGELERETNLRCDPRWERLARGTLPRADVEELKARCERGDTQVLFDAFAPLDAAVQERIIQHSLALLAPRPRQRPRRVAFAAMATAFCAAAAAIALVVGLHAEPVHFASLGAPPATLRLQEAAGPGAPDVTAMPPYRVEASGGDVPGAFRAAPASAPGALAAGVSSLGAGTPFGLVLRPGKAAPWSARLVACAVRDGRGREWPVSWERSAQGSFRVEGTRESLFAGEPAGEITLVLAVGSAAALPTCDALAAAIETPAAPRPDLAVMTHRVALR